MRVVEKNRDGKSAEALFDLVACEFSKILVIDTREPAEHFKARVRAA